MKIKSDKLYMHISNKFKNNIKGLAPYQGEHKILAPLHKMKLSQTRFKQHYKDNIPLMLITKTEPGSSHPPGF